MIGSVIHVSSTGFKKLKIFHNTDVQLRGGFNFPNKGGPNSEVFLSDLRKLIKIG